MVKVAVTELEFRKAEALFARAAEAGATAPAPAEEAGFAAAIRAGGIRHVIIGVDAARFTRR